MIHTILANVGLVLWLVTTVPSADASDLDNSFNVAPNSMTTIWLENRSSTPIRASVTAVATADSINNFHETNKYGVCNWRGGRCAAWGFSNGQNWACSNYNTCRGTFTLAAGEKKAVSYGSLLDMTRSHFGYPALHENVPGAGAVITASGEANAAALLRVAVESFNDYTDQRTTQSKDILVPKMGVSSVTPTRGLLDGGDTVVISGRDFKEGARVLFGGIAGRNVSCASSTSISVVAPPHETGAVSVEVVNPDGSSAVLSQGFTYLGAPQISYPVSTVVRPWSLLVLGAPNNSGGTVATYSISPPLPAGMKLNNRTGVIRGRPHSPLPSTSYTVTATNKYGTSSTTVSIEMLERIVLKAAPGNQKVFLDWNQIAGARSYNLYWSKTFPIDTMSAQKISNVTAPYTHQGKDLVNGDVYYYLVNPVSSHTGNEVEVVNRKGPHSTGATPSYFINLPQDTLKFTGLTGEINQIVSSGQRVYVATTKGIGISHDDGRSFKMTSSFQDSDTREVNFLAVSGPNIYANSGGVLYVSLDQGISFAPFQPDKYQKGAINRFQSSSLMAIRETESSPDTVYWGGVDQGVVARSSTCQGSKCSPLKTRFKDVTGRDSISIPTSSIAISGSTIYAGSNERCGIFVSRNGGESYTSLGKSEGLSGCYVTSVVALGTGVYVGTDKGLNVSTDGGYTFRLVTAPDDVKSNRISSLALSGSLLYVGTGGGLYVSPDGGTSFAQITTTQAVRSQQIGSLSVAADKVYVSTIDQTRRTQFHASDDGGITFRSVTPSRWPTISGEPVGSSPDAIFPFWKGLAVSDEAGSPLYRGVPRPHPECAKYGSNCPYIWISCLAFPESTLYCSDGKMFMSEDGGKSFKGLSCPTPSSGPSRFCNTEGGIVATNDGGRTFKRLKIGPSNGDGYIQFVAEVGNKLYVKGPDDSIGISEDGGRSVRWITVGYSEDPVRSPVEVGRVEFSGSNIVVTSKIRSEVYVSTDGGESFKTIKFPCQRYTPWYCVDRGSVTGISLVGSTAYLNLFRGDLFSLKVGPNTLNLIRQSTASWEGASSDLIILGLKMYSIPDGRVGVSEDGGASFKAISMRRFRSSTKKDGKMYGFTWWGDLIGMAP